MIHQFKVSHEGAGRSPSCAVIRFLRTTLFPICPLLFAPDRFVFLSLYIPDSISEADISYSVIYKYYTKL